MCFIPISAVVHEKIANHFKKAMFFMDMKLNLDLQQSLITNQSIQLGNSF